MKKIIDKIALIYLRDRKVLSTRSRGKTNFYLPGGKREAGESDLRCLQREIKEEMNVEILPASVVYYGTFSAPADGHPNGVSVKMTCYTADFTGNPVASAEIEEIRELTTDNVQEISAVDKLIFADLHNKGLLK